MMKLELNPAFCVRYSSKLSGCDKCEEICPVEAIKVSPGRVSIFQNECIGCGGCVGACPVEALRLRDFSVRDFFFSFLKEEESVISCKSNFVCLSALNPEYLISLALLKDFVLDLGHCEECSIKEKCFPKIGSNIDEANFVLSKISDKSVKVKHLKLSKEKEKREDRREIFKLFSPKNLEKAAKEKKKELNAFKRPQVSISPEDSVAKRDKIIPDKRKIFYSVLKRTKRPAFYEEIDGDKITFLSSKEIDESCDNCSICYRVCPSGALSAGGRGEVIYFDDMLCLRCGLCHDVCERDSVKNKRSFSVKEFFEPTQKPLIKFTVIRCEECGNFFTYFGGERMCKRCRIEEEEAKNLWGI